MYLSSQVYDDVLTNYFKEEEKFTLDTTIGMIVDCYLSNPDVIAVWLSYYPKLEIISLSLLFKDNESDGYTSEVLESNIPEDNNDKSKNDSIFLLSMKSNSNIKPITNSNLHSSTTYIFKKNVINYENVNNKRIRKLTNPS
jgi:hypothetical protein